jgi:hypothetical protein
MTRAAPLALVVLLAAACADDGGGPVEGRVYRGAAGDRFDDLRVVGEGFETEGAAVEIMIGIPDRAPERLGYARTTVSDGGFDVAFDAVSEPIYKQKLIWIDVDGDGACGEVDLVAADYSLNEGAWTWELPADHPFAWRLGVCELLEAYWPEQ